jgi:hypothetical protein
MRAESDRLAGLLKLRHSAEDVAAKASIIHRTLLEGSPHFRSANFEEIAPTDLRRLFDLYDHEFFGGLLEAMLREDRAFPMGFRLSSRMTNAGGKTIRRTLTSPKPSVSYEIAISTLLLFETFHQVDRPVEVVGLICRDRLEALQRIFEHELLHLAEFLSTGQSNCRAALFQTLAGSLFGHKAVVHNLVTPREIAATNHAIRIGDTVAFDFEGKTHVGRVNRITRRATILVEDPTAPLFSNGKRYATFYIPLDLLRKPG